jgi:hypothetical protein
MLKNKYVVWTSVSVLVAAFVAAGAWFDWHHHSVQQAAASLSAAEDSASTGSSEPITISANNNSGTPLSDGSSSSSGTAASSDAINKLLDPTTFGKYDSYKNNQTASFAELTTGSGTAIADGSQVAVLYKGWLTSGTLFDQSRAGSDGKLQAFTFTEGQHQVIPGWEEGLAGAKAGGVRMLIIPPAAGYGATGQGSIPANAVLIFQVQIIQVR